MNTAGEWIGALVTFPSYVTGDGEEPYRPTAVMWVDTESGAIIDSELVRPEQALARAAGLFLHATREPSAGPPRVPERLRVSDDALASALRGSIGDVELVVAPTPEIDEVVAAMKAHFTDPSRRDGEAVTFIGPDVTEDDVAAMFSAAARMYRAAPWASIPGDVCIGVSCDLLELDDGAMVVVGQMKQAYGFSLFSSIEDAVEFYDAAEAREQGGDGEDVALPPHLMFGFEGRDELPRQLVQEVAEHDWELADTNAYPSPVMVDADLVVRGLTRTELVGVTAIMTALADLVESESDLASAWEHEDHPITWKRTIATGLGDVQVELRAPLDMPHDLAAAAMDSIVDDSGDVDEILLEEFAAAMLDVLIEVPDVQEGHLRCADLLIQQAAGSFAKPLTYLSRDELDQLMFKIIPAKVAVEPEVASGLLDAARLVMLYAAHELELDAAKDTAEWLADPALVKELTTALADESRYSPTKLVILEGLRAGYDLTNEKGVAAWLDVLNGREKPAAKKSKSQPKAKAKPAVKAKATATATAKAKAKAKPVAKAKASGKTNGKATATSAVKAKATPVAKTKAKAKPVAKTKAKAAATKRR